MIAVTQAELTEFNLRNHIAPAVPRFMGITGVISWLGWFISLALRNPNLPELAVIHGTGGLAMILLGVLCHRMAVAGATNLTTLVSVVFVFVTASLLCVLAANNHTGLLQSLPYCMVLTAVSGFFWPNRWGLIVGSIAGMTPPIILVMAGYSQLAFTPRFFTIYSQLWLCAVAVSFSLYVLMNQVRRRYLTALRELEERSQRDFLTGLFNRRSFYEHVAASRSGVPGPALLLYLDVDHFKAINDRLGHDAGDNVLVRVARALDAASEPVDVISRFGGEEFVVYRPEAGAGGDSFVQMAERLRTALRVDPMRDGEPVTMSVGGTVVAPGEAFDAALQRADTALLQAKRDGRDRGVFLPGSVPVGEPAASVGREPHKMALHVATA
ncbi:MAG: GGDEF domain-containing protein [Thermomicrobiales bacterium]